jgi:chondroitin AC lyase
MGTSGPGRRLAAVALLGALASLATAHGGQTPSQDLAAVKKRLCEDLLPAAGDTRTAERAAAYVKSLGAAGTWKDVDYRNRTSSSWATARHLSRLLIMARAYRQPKGRLCGDAALKVATVKALDHWLKKDYRNPNWWWNEIGVPMNMGRILVLMEPELTAGQIAAGVRIMKRSRIGRTGQNLVWLAGNQVSWGALAGDAKAVAAAFARISREIRVFPGGGEGVKPDYSFWQHGRCLYSGGYGKCFSTDSARFAWLAGGTRWAFSRGNVAVLSSYVLDGQQWAVRGRTMDFGTTGREISRPGAGSSRFLISACRYLLALKTARREEFAALLDRLESGPDKAKTPLVGNRHFWKSDFMTHQRKDWYASARMFSTRIDNTDDPCNGEGLLSHHVADGVTYVMKRGDEYQRIFPVWNWRRLPGITAEQSGARLRGTPRSRGKRSFVGGASDGTYGLAAMDFARGKLVARKAWFFFDREFVALGAGISCQSGNPVVTSVNQCLLKGDVHGVRATTSKGALKLRARSWVHHDGVGYFFPEECAAYLGAGKQTGSWRRLRTASPGTKVETGVFSLAVDHGKQPKGAKYAYVVAPGVSAKEMPAYARDPGLDVISNTASLQAVRHGKLGVTAAAFYKAGRFSTREGLGVSVDKPCLLLLREGKQGTSATLSNPHNRKLEVNLTLVRGGRTIRKKIGLPGGEKAGSSVTAKL